MRKIRSHKSMYAFLNLPQELIREIKKIELKCWKKEWRDTQKAQSRLDDAV